MQKIKNNEILLIDKPEGWTSFDVVAKIRNQARRELGLKKIKVGHAGTLDPFATGLLVVGVGREATKKLSKIKDLRKEYEATVYLGATSDTGDTEGVITEKDVDIYPKKSEVKQVLKEFVGRQHQVPPMHSAKKVEGKKLYDLARAGQEVERKAVDIEIFKIKLLRYKAPELKIRVACSAGTYIRVLAEDIGKKLEVGGYCQALRRTKIGRFSVRRAWRIKS